MTRVVGFRALQHTAPEQPTEGKFGMPYGTAQETAIKLVEAVEDIIASDTTYKAEVASAIVDALLGTDKTAIVSKIQGIPPELFEIIGDGIVNAVKEAVLARLGGPNQIPPPV